MEPKKYVFPILRALVVQRALFSIAGCWVLLAYVELLVSEIHEANLISYYNSSELCHFIQTVKATTRNNSLYTDIQRSYSNLVGYVNAPHFSSQ